MGWTVQVSKLGRGKKFYSSPKHTVWLSDPPIRLFNKHWGSFPGVNWAGHEVNHSPPSGAYVQNEWSYISFPLLPLHAFMAWTVKTLPFPLPHYCCWPLIWPNSAMTSADKTYVVAATTCTTSQNIRGPYILLTQCMCIYASSTVLWTNSNYIPLQH